MRGSIFVNSGVSYLNAFLSEIRETTSRCRSELLFLPALCGSPPQTLTHYLSTVAGQSPCTALSVGRRK